LPYFTLKSYIFQGSSGLNPVLKYDIINELKLVFLKVKNETKKFV
tara:strand:- start:830 stop:964 length:135 start_codon:yes stop_codon:yes gene_type:complete